MVGAAVLVAAAVILIPEMLSGPRQTDGETPRPATGDTPLKTYTIDLSKAPGAQPAVPTSADRAPPPENVVSLPAPGTTEHITQEPIATVEEPAPQPVPAQVASQTSNQTTASRPPETTASRPTPDIALPPAPETTAPVAATPVASTATPAASPGPASGSWAVQVGSFSKEATATKISQDLRAQGNPAFVMPVKSGTGTLYRVRIGPMRDRAAAEDLARRLKATNPAAAVVTHP
jgi:DedD protein